MDVTDRLILTQICKLLDVSSTDMTNQNRQAHLSRKRQMIYYYLRMDLGWQWNRIGKLMERHHATIIDGYKKAKHQLEIYTDTQELYAKLHQETADYIELNPYLLQALTTLI